MKLIRVYCCGLCGRNDLGECAYDGEPVRCDDSCENWEPGEPYCDVCKRATRYGSPERTYCDVLGDDVEFERYEED